MPCCEGERTLDALTATLARAEVPPHVRRLGIVSGYAVLHPNTQGQAWASLFRWHNESSNAWTMVVLALASLCLTLTAANLDAATMCLTAAVLMHCPFSVGCSLSTPIDKATGSAWKRWDWCALNAAAVPITFGLGYHGMPALLCALNVGVTLRLAIGNVRRPGRADRRARALIPLVLSFNFPILFHCARPFARECARGVLGSLLIGGAAYSLKIPERWFPGAFDYAGSSHHLMHVMLIVAHAYQHRFVASLMSLRSSPNEG